MSRTPSVTLRSRTDQDADLLYELASDLATWDERSPLPPAPMTRGAYDAKLDAEDGDTSGTSMRFMIEADGIAVGSISLFGIDRFAGIAEVGVGLVAGARGKGTGTAAVAQIVEFAFVRGNLHRLHLQAVASNVAAIRAYEKVGFVVEGTQREHAWVRGHREDIVIMGLLRSEWNAPVPATSVGD